jgi:hypothetical protein
MAIRSQDCQYPDRDMNRVSPDCDWHALPLEPAWLAVKICIFVSISCANELKVRITLQPQIQIRKTTLFAGPGVSAKVKAAVKSLWTSWRRMGIEEVQLHSFLNSALDEHELPAPAALPPKKEPFVYIQRGTRNRGGRFGEEKYFFFPCGESSQDSSGVQPEAHCIPPKLRTSNPSNIKSFKYVTSWHTAEDCEQDFKMG